MQPLSRPAIIVQRTHDYGATAPGTIPFAMPSPQSMFTFDQQTMDSTGSFLISELDRLDYRPYQPLYSVTWGRDIDVRADVTVTDETASFLNSSFGTPGGMEPGGISWIGRDTNAITGVQLDIGRTIQPLHPWGMELSYTIPELLTSQRLLRPIDVDKYNAIQIKYQMDIDQLVYIGDAKIGSFGLVNHPSVTSVSNVANVGGNILWSAKQPADILADLNTFIIGAWTASGFAYAPTHVLLPPAQFGRLTSSLVSTAGSQSILSFLKENSISNQINGAPLIIAPVKWLTGRGVSGADRMVAYRKDESMVRFPMTALQKTPLETRSLYQLVTYWGKLGQVEVPRPEVMAYMDGL